MITRIRRMLASLCIVGLLSACGHTSGVVPSSEHSSAASAKGRHVRDVVIPEIGRVTSRASYNGIYLPFLNAAYGGGESSPIDWGSQIGNKVPPPPADCTDAADQCPVSYCDPSDPDCVVLLAGLGGPAKPGDTCGNGSEPIGAPVQGGSNERIADIIKVFDDYEKAKLELTVPLGYVYVSDKGVNYFQPNASFAVGGGAVITGSIGTVEPPYIKMGNITASELAKTFNLALDAAKLAGYAVNPAAYNIIKAGTVGKQPCFSSPHGSNWT